MIFFTSDHHFSHQNIIKYCNRPFNSIEEMNEEMIKRWNETVKEEDIVWYLGDFSLSIKPVENYLKRLNGTKYLVVGNHDQCHPCHGKRSERLKETYLKAGFSLILKEGAYGPLLDSSMKDYFLMSHMPYKDEYDSRYPQYRPINDGKWLLHGHVHNRWHIKDKMINVGVDVNDFRPVSLDKIKEIIEFHNKLNEIIKYGQAEMLDIMGLKEVEGGFTIK